MPKGTYLADTEKAVIDQLHSLNISNREIARRIGRSHRVVGNYIQKGNSYGDKKKTKGNSKITNRQKNQLIALASAGNHSSRELVAELGLPIGHKHAAKILKRTGHFKFTKKMKQPFLKPEHETARMDWASKYIHWTTEWTNIVFSDEKKFNLDGPDGCSYYWHDLRKEKKFNFSRNFGGGTLMLWAGFSMYGKTPLVKISTRMNSRNYIEMLNDVLIPFSDDFMDGDFMYQQDNASIHVSKESKAWFASVDIELLDWPARSPDLNPMENLWGILARKVYHGGRKYSSIQELEVAVRHYWRQIDTSMLEKLVNSMPNRLFKLVKRNGKQIDY